jgi:hypothetical protein
LINALHDASREIGADLTIALLPGSSFINRPESLSAQYQEYLQKRVVAELGGVSDISVIDLANSMQADQEDTKKQCYLPNEGHLTPQGHRYFAQLLAGGI